MCNLSYLYLARVIASLLIDLKTKRTVSRLYQYLHSPFTLQQAC